MPDGSGPQAGPGQTAAPVLMNHTAGSRSPAELRTGGGEERGGGEALPQWPEERREGALQALQAGTINPSGSYQKYKQAGLSLHPVCRELSMTLRSSASSTCIIVFLLSSFIPISAF